MRSRTRPTAASIDLRVLRALPFATVCVVVSAVGHGAASGAPVPLGVLLAAWLGVWAVAAAFAGRERTLPGIAGGLASGQLGLHLIFHYLAGCNRAGAGAMAGMRGHAASAALDRVATQLLCGPLPQGTSAAEVVSRAGLDPSRYTAGAAAAHLPPQLWFCTHTLALGLTPAMITGHLLAALAAGWWLRRGEAAVWRLLRWYGAQAVEPLRGVLALAVLLVRGLLGLPRRAGAPRARADRDEEPLPPGATLRHVVIRRGPPAVAAFAPVLAA